MEQKDIEMFLNLVSTRNISKTADNLFVSQSAVSNRLKKLEEEIGCQLIVRSKGMRSVDLTQQGEEFVPIAQRWERMIDETAALSSSYMHTIRIASNESTYYEYLEQMLADFLCEHPKFKLSVQISDSATIYNMMEKKLIDYGFASYESTRSRIIHQCINSQSFCVAKYCENPGPFSAISPSELDPKMEIRFTGGHFSTLSVWREKWFGTHDNGRLEINSPQAIVPYLKTMGGWVLCPEGTANLLKKRIPLQIYKLTDPPEDRKIYLLKHESEKVIQSQAEICFEEKLRQIFLF